MAVKWDGRLILGWVGVIGIVVFIIAMVTEPGSSGENPNDYSLCSALATSPGTDVMHAKCTDDNGDVIKYKDSVYGKAIMDLANQ